MTPANLIIYQVPFLLFNNSGLFGAPGGMNIHLAKAPFVPSPALTLAGLVEADFQGYAPTNVVANILTMDRDADALLIDIDGAEGWQVWGIADNATLNLPQTVFGFYLTDLANTTLYGSQLFPEPFLFPSAPGYFYNAVLFNGPVQFRWPVTFLR